jgi:Protein of unknown function (DUF4199)
MEEQRAASMVRIATKYGLITGVLAFVVFVVRTLAGIKASWAPLAADAVILIVLMVLSHREFRRSHNGMMTYPQGLGSGTLLSSVAAVLTGILVYVYVQYINTEYLAVATQAERAALAQRGITGAQAQQAMAIAGAIATPVGIAVTSLITGVIVGFIAALIVSIFTQKGDSSVVI